MTRFNLALRLLWRDSRSGELTILILALIIAQLPFYRYLVWKRSGAFAIAAMPVQLLY